MELSHTQFQSLSACEAMRMETTINRTIRESFKGGLRTAFLMEKTSQHPAEHVGNVKYYLNEAGVYLDDDTALSLLVHALLDVVRQEEALIQTDPLPAHPGCCDICDTGGCCKEESEDP